MDSPNPGPFSDAGQALAAAAAVYADHPALHLEGDTASYGFLHRAALVIARRLLAEGVTRGDTVGLCLDKRLTAYASVVACLRLGVPYFFIDPESPAPRVAHVVERAAPRVVLTHHPDVPLPDVPTVIQLDDQAVRSEASAIDPVWPHPWAIAGTDPAYVMFTSGSTGVPKGATISHDNLLHFMAWTRQTFALSATDVIANLNPLHFDNSVFDLCSSLSSGASLVPVSAQSLRTPAVALEQLTRVGCTVWFSVPSLLVYLQTLKLFSAETLPTLRWLIFGGEGYPKPKLTQLWQAIGSRTHLVNVYGPTECTCICSAHVVTADDLAAPEGLVPLGRLNAGYAVTIVDSEQKVINDDRVGELLLGGPSVGLGYYREPALTAAAFVQHPAHTRFHDRVYRTGDLVRRDSRGYLHFVGRIDSQIKHQGYRIELGDVEHGLTRVDGVDEAAAVYVGRIVGVVAGRALRPETVKRSAAGLLPKYMVPDRIIVMTQLPKNANGKVDRQALTRLLTETSPSPGDGR